MHRLCVILCNKHILVFKAAIGRLPLIDFSDKKCINNMLHNTVDFEGIMGNITIQSGGKALRPLVVNRIHKGELKFVVKVY